MAGLKVVERIEGRTGDGEGRSPRERPAEIPLQLEPARRVAQHEASAVEPHRAEARRDDLASQAGRGARHGVLGVALEQLYRRIGPGPHVRRAEIGAQPADGAHAEAAHPEVPESEVGGRGDWAPT